MQVSQEYKNAQDQLREIEKEIAQNKVELAELREQWEKEKSGTLDVHQLRSQLAEAELEYKTLETQINSEQSKGRMVDESQYQRLFELDQKRKVLDKQVEEAEIEPTTEDGKGQ